MSTVTVHARGAADPDVVWQRYADPSAWPTWAPQIRRVDTDAARITAGASGRVVGLTGLPSVRFVIDQVDEAARCWTWTVRLGPLVLHLAHTVHATDDGTRTSLRITGPLPVIAAYAPIAQLALRRLVRP